MKIRTSLLNALGLVYLLIGLWISSAMAQMAIPLNLNQVIEKVEAHRRGWIAFKAEVELKLVTDDQHAANCEGDLTYERLEEKILLRCFGASRGGVTPPLLFIFRTSDRKFELYLPAQETVFHGDIFDLEDSPEIESHLKPLDLYRALKTMAIPLEQTSLEREDGGTVSLRIYGEHHRAPYLARRIFINENGEVPVEIYYDFEENQTALIRRYDFKKTLLAEGRKKHKISFPHQIVIEETRRNGKSLSNTATTLFLRKVKFLPAAEPEDWLVAIPGQTKITPLRGLLLRHAMNGPEPVNEGPAGNAHDTPAGK